MYCGITLLNDGKIGAVGANKKRTYTLNIK